MQGDIYSSWGLEFYILGGHYLACYKHYLDMFRNLHS